MNKQLMYSNDITWYDPAIYNAITELDNKYSNAISIFGGALGAYNSLQAGDTDRFIRILFTAINDAKFYKWHESSIQVARRFCHLCFIDPHLIELYIGMTFDELCNNNH